MKKSMFIKALWPIGIFGALVLLLYLLIGGDKANFALQIFSLPWSVLFEVDPYAENLSPLKLFLSENYFVVLIAGLLFNTAILYTISLLYLRQKDTSIFPTS